MGEHRAITNSIFEFYSELKKHKDSVPDEVKVLIDELGFYANRLIYWDSDFGDPYQQVYKQMERMEADPSQAKDRENKYIIKHFQIRAIRNRLEKIHAAHPITPRVIQDQLFEINAILDWLPPEGKKDDS